MMTSNVLDFINNTEFDVVGIGSPLMDFILQVDDKILVELNLQKGQMHLIDESLSREIFEKIKDYQIDIIPGGSAANVLAGVTYLGGKGAFIGKVGNDEHGALYKNESEKFGVKTYLAFNSLLSLVTFS